MKYLIGIIFFCSLSIGFAQQSEFESIINELQSNLIEVQTGDETYTHEIELLGYSVLKYSLVEVDEKGGEGAQSFS